MSQSHRFITQHAAHDFVRGRPQQTLDHSQLVNLEQRISLNLIAVVLKVV